MAIKRYLPRYKKLLRFYRPIWFEKRVKLRKFEKQKWERVKKLYYPRKLRFFRQDVSSYPVAKHLNVDRSVRLKKTYKFLLADKQRLQLYYGSRRLRFFQLKNLARKLRNRKISKGLPPSKAFLMLLENRLDIVLYRFSIVNSVVQARKLIQNGCVKVNGGLEKNPSFVLNPENILSFDPSLKDWFLGTYLRKIFPYFFYKNKKKRRKIIGKRKEIWEQAFVDRKIKKTYSKLKKFILKLKEKKEHDSISKKKFDYQEKEEASSSRKKRKKNLGKR